MVAYFLFEGPTPEPPPPRPCKEHLDVGLIIDSSGSIEPPDYAKVRQFVTQLANRLQISEAGTHMAILLYSFEAHLWHRYAAETKARLRYMPCIWDNSLVCHQKNLNESEIGLRLASMLVSVA